MKVTHFVTLAPLIARNTRMTQRELSQASSLSLGLVNGALNKYLACGLLERDEEGGLHLTAKGRDELETYRVKNAAILSAGFGSRAVPLTYETPKGLLKVFGTPMIERQIEQLLEVGITEIIVVVGYKKEAFDYLIDKYGVELVYNPEYSTKNNLASLNLVADRLGGSYVLMSDNWIEDNIFHTYEARSWFSCPFFEGPTAEWCVKTTPSGRILDITIGGEDSLAIVGPAYFTPEFCETFVPLLAEYYARPGTEDFYWEHVLKDAIGSLEMYVNEQTGNVHEFENLEELRDYDPSYNERTNNAIMELIAEHFGVSEAKIRGIYPLKEGVTNSSFHFSIGNDEYVFRVPGIGTEKLIDRANEKAVYEAIGPLGISDDVVRFEADSGIKITRFINDTHNSDPCDDGELRLSMQQVRKIHEKCLHAPNDFAIDSMIDFYVSLNEELDAITFADIDKTARKVQELLKLRDALAIPEILCHGDFAHTNVLVLPDGSAKIIDFEYSGNSDPIMDVSMYTIYAEFEKERIDLALRLYLDREPTRQEWIRCYLYVALGGYLWSMWGQYKQAMGQEFGEYPLKMYRYMKDYYELIQELLAEDESAPVVVASAKAGART